MTSTSERGPFRSKKNLYVRLAELERIHEQTKRATKESADESNDSLLQRLQEIIDISGIERLPTESWFDVTARALDITSREMRAQLQTNAFDATFSKWAAAREAEMDEIQRKYNSAAAQPGSVDIESLPSATHPGSGIWSE